MLDTKHGYGIVLDTRHGYVIALDTIHGYAVAPELLQIHRRQIDIICLFIHSEMS